MFRAKFSHLLMLIWKLSSVFIIPVIIHFYLSIMPLYIEGFNFNTLDEGQNIHKWMIFIIYLLYLFIWKSCNKSVRNYLKKIEFS